ncbi:MAG: hypothetical protein L0Z55_07750 [Planctomycetes bacterium]|nr:hypothetical protein [Planctomycetota bacterium]
MPHVIIRNPPSLAEYQRAFRPLKERAADGTVLEARAAYLRQDGRVLLVEALCLELGPAQAFFIALEEKKAQVTVRCFPTPSPARTPGVKRLVRLVAEDLLRLGGEIEKTNIEA